MGFLIPGSQVRVLSGVLFTAENKAFLGTSVSGKLSGILVRLPETPSPTKQMQRARVQHATSTNP